jgi:hypothetical protein
VVNDESKAFYRERCNSMKISQRRFLLHLRLGFGKTLLKMLGIIAIAALVGFSMTACPGDPAGGGNSGGPTRLTENVWTEGEITDADGFIGYTFVAEYEPTYYIWWNDKGQGDGSYTGDIQVSASKSNGNSVPNFTNVDSAWQIARMNSALSSQGKTETIRIRVEMKDNKIANAGTFAIVYSTEPSQPPNIPSSGITPLTKNVWEDGNITNANGAEWYSLVVTNEKTYYFWWNEIDANGNGTKTADVSVGFYYGNGKAVVSGSGATPLVDQPTAWATPVSFTEASSGTVYVRVKPNNANANNTGTYGIVYSEGSARPTAPFNVTATELNDSEWKDGELPTTNSIEWYKFEVTNGSTYNLWWNDYNDGDNTKTGDVKVTVFSNEGAILIAEKNASWNSASPFTADYTGTAYVKVVPYSSISRIGTYGIVFSTRTTKPLILPATITELTADQWVNGNIAANGADWYSISVTTGTYRLWWNEEGDDMYGNGTKTANVNVSVWYSDGRHIIDQSTAWTTAASFISTSTDTVYVVVTPASSSYGGTYGISYSTENTRPPSPIDVNATPLVEKTWANGNIDENDIHWYSIVVTNGATYRFWLNQRGTSYGDGSKTGEARVSVWYSNGTLTSIYDQYNAWNAPVSFISNSAGTVYVKVIPAVGTYGIVYSSTNDPRPPVP